MPFRVTKIDNPASTGGAVAKKAVQLTPEQMAKLEDAFTKAISQTLGEQKVAWLSGGFSKA